MQDQFRDLWARPSRLAGWGLVAFIHVLLWQVFSHGLDVSRFIPVLQSVQVTMMSPEQPPPAAPPQVPNVDLPVANEMYVPTPEVQVVRESSPQFVTTSIVPVTMVSEEAPTAAATLKQSPPLPVVSDSEVDYVVRPEVRFPLAAKRAREHGTVLLSVIVDENGLVRQIRVHRSSGFHRLDDVALKALRALRVKPYTRNGMAMSVEIRVPVEFPLSNAV